VEQALAFKARMDKISKEIYIEKTTALTRKQFRRGVLLRAKLGPTKSSSLN
jgi:hypothetical protein